MAAGSQHPFSTQAVAAQVVCSLECCQGWEQDDAGGGPGGETALLVVFPEDIGYGSETSPDRL